MHQSTTETARPGGEPPDLVPARMINEVLYCERLMYLEWVQGEFADNYFTVDGRSVHRKVDARDGRLPAPGEGDAPAVARSVWLSSAKLGITAKIDLVEMDGLQVVPIEYKRGKKPRLPEGAYLPERAQLCAQVLLLREHGYVCDHGEIYFAGDRKRVVIDMDEELVAMTRRAVARARDVAVGSMPAPLVNDPKCRGCSLAPLCLPDEINELGHRIADKEVRRLQPARDDKLPLYVQEHGTTIGVSRGRLLVRKGGEEHPVRLADTSHVSVFGYVQVTTQALSAMFRAGVPCTFFSTGGWLLGSAVGLDSKNVELRMAQHRAAGDTQFALRLARAFVEGKIRNSRTLIRRNHPQVEERTLKQLAQFARKAKNAPSLDSLLGIEGSAAREYFRGFGGMLKPTPGELGTFDFDGRNRRPPRDPVNAMLSLAYALLAKDVQLAISRVGMDPLLGFYHQPRFGRAALALDLMEEFRPLIADSVVLAAVNNGVVKAADFLVSEAGTAMRSAGRKRFIQGYERRMDHLVTHPIFKYRISYRRVLEVQARLVARLLLGELDAYPPFRTR